MVFKIFNNIGNIGQVYVSITDSILDFAPYDKFTETRHPSEADLILLQACFGGGSVVINAHHGSIDLKNLDIVAPKINALREKRRIIWVDVTGPGITRVGDMFSEAKCGLTDKDFVISPATVPPGDPIIFTHLFHLEKAVFRQYPRFNRVVGSVMITHDNMSHALPMVKSVMPSISELHVTNAAHPEEHVKSAMIEYRDKVIYEYLRYPRGIAYKASQCEFVLHTYTDIGVEMMGIEAGMTGCQPIYPDTEFYRDIFDCTGVAFYNTADAVTSLKSIIEGGSTFTPEQVEAFRTKFSAEDNLPCFWNTVFEQMTEKTSNETS